MTSDKKICDKCNKVHVTIYGNPSCNAHRKGLPDTPCARPPIRGGKVCRHHGNNGFHHHNAVERVALMEAQGEMADLMLECDVENPNPVLGLLEVVRLSGAMMRMMALKVGELSEDPRIIEVLVEGPGGQLSTKRITTEDAFWGLDSKGEMAAHLYVNLLRVWTERYERACKTCIDAGIAERQVQLAESQGELIATAVRGILQSLNLSPEQWELAPRVVSAQLRALTAAS